MLATAIDKYSYVTASTFHSHLFDYAVRISYSKGELAKTIEDIQHPVFRECLRFCGLAKDIELHTVADLPSFTGLGSSSSFTVALLKALHAYKGEYVTPLQLAYEAIYIERDVLKECVGVQDQTTAAVGGFNLLEFRAKDDIRVHPLALTASRTREFEEHLLLLFTGIKRQAQTIERVKLENFEVKRELLRSMKKMVEKGCEILQTGVSLANFGELLREAWVSKRRLAAAVTNDEIDRLYALGLAEGAWGGKLLGAGGGGFMLFMAPPETHARLRRAFAGHHLVSCKINAPGADIIFAG